MTVNCGQLWVVQADRDQIVQCTEVRFPSFFSGGFIAAIVVNSSKFTRKGTGKTHLCAVYQYST